MSHPCVYVTLQMASALYWRHLHRLNDLAHANLQGPPG